MPPESRSVLSDLPRDLVAGVVAVAARDAALVGNFLAELGFRGSPEKPIHLPARFLVHLAAALRLQEWEAEGHHYHLQAGLPGATEAIDDAFATLDTASEPTELADAVLDLMIDRFAWYGRSLLGADVALGDLTNPGLLDALAEFLWSTRHDTTKTLTVRP